VLCLLPLISVRRRLRSIPSLAPTHGAILVWCIVTALLAVRFVLSFRTAILPPFNLDLAGAATFGSTFRKAYWAAALIPPSIGLFVALVARAPFLHSKP